MFQKQSRPLILDFTNHRLRFVFKRFNAGKSRVKSELLHHLLSPSLSLSLSLLPSTILAAQRRHRSDDTREKLRDYATDGTQFPSQIYVNHCCFPGSVGNINYTSDRASSVRLNAGSAGLLNIRWPAPNAISLGKKAFRVCRFVTSKDSSVSISIWIEYKKKKKEHFTVFLSFSDSVHSHRLTCSVGS